MSMEDEQIDDLEEPGVRDYESEELLRQRQRERMRARRRQEMRRRERRKRMLLLGSMLALVILTTTGVRLAAGHFSERKENRKEDKGVQTADKAEPDEKALTDKAEPDKKGRRELSGSAMLNDASEALTLAVAQQMEEEERGQEKEEIPFAAGYTAQKTDSTAAIAGESVQSSNALLIDLDDNIVVAQKGAYERIIPASMTKILTLLVAVEHIEDIKDTFTITREITDYSYRNDCSAAGFADGETVTVEDLLYGTILPSGGDAAAGLAYYVSGSLEGFVELMNEKIAELGLSETAHFTNCVGLYDVDHYCTSYDMAVMLKAAVENSLCREVLSAHIYTTSPTEQHPEGIELSNWFLRRIEDKETNGEVVCAKTGYVAQSGSCAASYEISASGRHYLCVTANAHSSWRCIYDHVAIYQQYTK